MTNCFCNDTKRNRRKTEKLALKRVHPHPVCSPASFQTRNSRNLISTPSLTPSSRQGGTIRWVEPDQDYIYNLILTMSRKTWHSAAVCLFQLGFPELDMEKGKESEVIFSWTGKQPKKSFAFVYKNKRQSLSLTSSSRSDYSTV